MPTPSPCAQRFVAAAIVGILLSATLSAAQTIRLRQEGTNQTRISTQVGQVVTIEVFADLQGVAAAGVSFFISVPEGAFVVSDQGLPGQDGNQPFRVRENSLFFGGVVTANLLLPESDQVAQTVPGQQLDFNMVIGAGSDRNRSGSGVIATFQLVAVRPIENGQIKIDSNPIRETKLVLADGVSERRFTTTQGMEITVTGLELLDIPDVILQPGQSDSVQIGSLDQYLVNTLSAPDSIRWAFEPTDAAAQATLDDSVEITVDPGTRRVKIVPLNEWRGSLRLRWTATDPRRAAPGQPLLTAADVSTIVVNNRPRFQIPRDADGVKRDTVRLVEDRNTFVVGVTNLDPRRAFRAFDLDELVVDPDITDPDRELVYLVLPLPVGSRILDANVRGDDAADTHELLVWTRPDFGGTDTLGVRVVDGDTSLVIGGRDSMRVIVQDAFRGTDTLRVIVEVEEVADAPRIIETQREPRISRGGTKRYLFPEFVEDPDTPLDDLVVTWVDDPAEHFTVDSTRTDKGDLVLEVRGDPAFTGTGRVVIRVADPVQPSLADTAIFFFTSAEALPPDVFPPDVKIDLFPDGFWSENLDLFVSDPDNDDNELRWSIPPVSRTTITIDEERTLGVRAPKDFVGYEEVELTVLDPGNQSDVLKLRIYSSDGRPVVGGIPDLILDRGQEDRDLDLDQYYHDENNTDNQMVWRTEPTFNPDNLTVEIDPLTHIVTFAASTRATFGTETVIFQVTDPGGISATDTMLVTIRSGGVGSGGAFSISPPIPPLEAPVGQAVELVADMNDHILASPLLPKSSITWELADDGEVGIAFLRRVRDDTKAAGVRWVLSAFSDSSGTDTLRFVATDSLGRSESAVTTVRYFGESERLELRSLPDIVFISGQVYNALRLNDFILDHEAHPDSVMQWSRLDIGTGEGTIILEIDADSRVRALSFDITETQVVFVARDTVLGVTGRDTVRVIAQDPALAARPLKDLPPLIIEAGSVDSSLVLNDFLPDDVEAVQTNWSVSGQSLTVPVIDPVPPHRLRLATVGTSVGTDSLQLRVSLGGGFVATGTLPVTVIEPVDESTLTLRLVPNPIHVNFVDFFVMARTELTSSPTVVVTFAGDTTVAVRQIEDDIAARGVLIWAGSFRVPPGGSGALLFRAQAITALGTSVQATASMTIGTAASGKALVLRHGAAVLRLPPGAVDDGQMVMLQSAPTGSGMEGATRVAGQEGLSVLRRLSLWPLGLRLRTGGRLQAGPLPARTGLYRADEARGWVWVGDSAAVVDRLGVFGVILDEVAPRVEVVEAEEGLVLHVVDTGSGVAPGGVWVELGGQRSDPRPAGPGLWRLEPSPSGSGAGQSSGVVVARDRAGNQTRHPFVSRTPPRPEVPALGANFPNPFNPGTTIPFRLTDGDGAVRLRVYDVTGQLVRELLVSESLPPGWHEVVWDGRDDAGFGVASGTYFYRLETGGRVLSRSMTLLQ